MKNTAKNRPNKGNQSIKLHFQGRNDFGGDLHLQHVIRAEHLGLCVTQHFYLECGITAMLQPGHCCESRFTE